MKEKSIESGYPDGALIGSGAIVLIGAYIAAQMLSDIGSLKIASLGGWAVDAGTFVYPVTFTIRDMIHKRLGKRRTNNHSVGGWC
ncbi:hypothetical protein MASR2M48_33820 [Spirochaetota bacterium]